MFLHGFYIIFNRLSLIGYKYFYTKDSVLYKKTGIRLFIPLINDGLADISYFARWR